MSKNLISVLILGVVLVGGYFIIKNGKRPDTAPAVYNEMNNGEEIANNAGKKMAFSEFLKTNTSSYKCDVKQAMSDFENSGTVYVDGQKVRGDFSTIAEGKTMTTSLIVRDDTSYMWSNGENGLPEIGFKAKVNSENNLEGWRESIGDYDCELWTVDEAMFAVPTNITFQEVGA
jgi:hypothetical protein